MKTLIINPELLSDKPTHTDKGVKVKIFTRGMEPSYTLEGVRIYTAEIMEGDHRGKWTSCEEPNLIKL